MLYYNEEDVHELTNLGVVDNCNKSSIIAIENAKYAKLGDISVAAGLVSTSRSSRNIFCQYFPFPICSTSENCTGRMYFLNYFAP